MKVSVITPTHGRSRHLELLYQVFAAQTHPDKELLVDDDSPEPSAFMAALDDPRVRYRHTPERATVGAKRARLVAAARGEVIAHFDDDDYYAPDYLEHMLAALGGDDLVTLSGWFLFDTRTRGFYYWDSAKVDEVHIRVDAAAAPRALSMRGLGDGRDAWLEKPLWGYGFSYVFRRDTATFDPTLGHGEDLAFVNAARAAGRRVRAVPDARGLVLHVIHTGNMASVFPNYRLPELLVERVFGANVLPYLDAAG